MSNFGRSRRRKTRYEIPKEEQDKLVKDLKEFPTKLRNRILRSAYKEWGEIVKGSVKSGITWDDRAMRRQVHQKIKSFRRGKVLWTSIGIKTSRSKDSPLVGWRAHFYNGGWRPYPKGTPTDGKGKGRAWRRGKRGVVGQKIYETRFMSSAADQHQSKLVPILQETIKRVVQEISQGNQ